MQWYFPSVGDMMSKEVNDVMTKLVVGNIYYQAIFLKPFEQQVKMLFVSCYVLASE